MIAFFESKEARVLKRIRDNAFHSKEDDFKAIVAQVSEMPMRGFLGPAQGDAIHFTATEMHFRAAFPESATATGAGYAFRTALSSSLRFDSLLRDLLDHTIGYIFTKYLGEDKKSVSLKKVRIPVYKGTKEFALPFFLSLSDRQR